MKVKLDNNRKILGEGRNYELGYAFAKYTDEGVEGVMPITACKDYLNDVVHVEKYNKEYPSIYGFKHKPINLFKDRKKHSILLVSILDYLNKGWLDYNHYVKLLNNNYKNIEYYINSIEKDLNIPYKTSIVKLDDNLFLFKFSKEWVKQTYLISLYTYLPRLAIYLNDKVSYRDFKKDCIKSSSKKYEYDKFYEKLLTLINKGIYDAQQVNENSKIGTIHNAGFFTLKL